MSEQMLMWIIGLAVLALGALVAFVFRWLTHLSAEVKQVGRDVHQLALDVANQYVRSPALDETKEALRDFSDRVTHSIDGLQNEIKELSKAVFMFMGSAGNK